MLNGILLFRKPQNFTSHDAVAKLRGILKMRKIGHAGTLDPMAEGLLVVLLGNATRASDYAAGLQKEYVATFLLGQTTDTQDSTGTVLSQSPVACSREDVERAVLSFQGQYEQLPPMYSAVQKDGVRLYKLARKGQEVEREARTIVIDEIELLPEEPALREHEYRVRVRCSKGTYVRTLCHDIGQALGCGACMTSLVRTRCGGYRLEDALTFAQVEQARDKGTLAQSIIPVETVFAPYPRVTATAEGAVRALNGAHLSAQHLAEGAVPVPDGLCRVYNEAGEFLMLGVGGELDIGGNAIFCKKIFYARDE